MNKPVAIYKRSGEPWTEIEAEIVTRKYGSNGQIEIRDWGHIDPEEKYMYVDEDGLIASWDYTNNITTEEYDIKSFEDELHLPGSETASNYVTSEIIDARDIPEHSVVLCNENNSNQFISGRLYVTRNSTSKDIVRIELDSIGAYLNGWGLNKFRLVKTRPSDTISSGDRVICKRNIGSLRYGDIFTVMSVSDTDCIHPFAAECNFSNYSPNSSESWHVNNFRALVYTDDTVEHIGQNSDIDTEYIPPVKPLYKLQKRRESIFYKG